MRPGELHLLEGRSLERDRHELGIRRERKRCVGREDRGGHEARLHPHGRSCAARLRSDLLHRNDAVVAQCRPGMASGTAHALEHRATAPNLPGLHRGCRRMQQVLKRRHRVVGIVGGLSRHGGEEAVIGHVVGGGETRQHGVAVETGCSRSRVGRVQHLRRALARGRIVAKGSGRRALEDRAEIDLRIQPEQGPSRLRLLGRIGIGGVNVVVERGQPLERSDPGAPAPAIRLGIGREARGNRGRVGLAIGGGIEAAGGPARDLHLGRSLETGTVRERGLRAALGDHLACCIAGMGGGIGTAMHEVGGRVARQRHQQAGIEVGVGRALHHLARGGIDGGMAERAGDPHAQATAVVEGADAEDEGRVSRHVEPRRDQFPRLPNPVAHRDVAGHAHLKIVRAPPSEESDGAGDLVGCHPALEHSHHVGEEHLVAEGLPIEGFPAAPHQRLVDRDGAAFGRQDAASLRRSLQLLSLVPCDSSPQDVIGGAQRVARRIEEIAFVRHRRIAETGH